MKYISQKEDTYWLKLPLRKRLCSSFSHDQAVYLFGIWGITKPKLMNPTPSHSPAAVQETAIPASFPLDVIRGKAILGLLITSIWAFAGFGLMNGPSILTAAHGGNYKLLYIISILFEGRMAALLALVFGAGIVLFLHKKEKHPVAISGPDAFIRQQIWLILFGLLSAFIIISPEDLLYPFGIVGILLFAFWKMPARSLLIASLVCTLIYCGKNYWNYAEDKNCLSKIYCRNRC